MPLPSPRLTLVSARPIGRPDPAPPLPDFGGILPEEVPGILRRAAALYRETAADVQCATQDAASGRVWLRLARTLDEAATKAEGALD